MPKPSDKHAPASPRRASTFRDPARNPRVWIVFIILIAAMVPVWPIEGSWFGVPAWAAFALTVSAVTSLFIAWVSLRYWRDGDNDKERAPDAD